MDTWFLIRRHGFYETFTLADKTRQFGDQKQLIVISDFSAKWLEPFEPRGVIGTDVKTKQSISQSKIGTISVSSVSVDQTSFSRTYPDGSLPHSQLRQRQTGRGSVSVSLNDKEIDRRGHRFANSSSLAEFTGFDLPRIRRPCGSSRTRSRSITIFFCYLSGAKTEPAGN